MNVVIIGRGRVGNGLRRSLDRSNFHVTSLGRSARRPAVRTADAIVIAVPDDAIALVADQIAPELPKGVVVVHCAGARGLDELRACEAHGASTGVMHPLVSFPSTKKSPSLVGTTFTVSGNRRAVSASKRIAAACGARVVVATTGDPAYHAAAALVANGAAALAFTSVTILESLGFERRAAERAIGGLLQSVGENVRTLGVPDALTGPVARSDAETIVRHRQALRRIGRGALSAYDAIVPAIVRCARAAGLSDARARAILDLVKR